MDLIEFDQEMANTRKTLERVPVEKFDWKPHQKSWPLRNLAIHVANIPSWAAMTMQADFIDIAGPFEPPKAENAQELLALFDTGVAGSRAALERATAEQLAAPWTLRAGDQVIFTRPRGQVIRSMVMNHMIHHRAQLTVYLRLLDVPVPGLYGPSADEQ